MTYVEDTSNSEANELDAFYLKNANDLLDKFVELYDNVTIDEGLEELSSITSDSETVNIDTDEAVISGYFRIKGDDASEAWLEYTDKEGNKIRIEEDELADQSSDFNEDSYFMMVLDSDESHIEDFVEKYALRQGEFILMYSELDSDKSYVIKGSLKNGSDTAWNKIRDELDFQDNE